MCPSLLSFHATIDEATEMAVWEEYHASKNDCSFRVELKTCCVQDFCKSKKSKEIFRLLGGFVA